MIQRAHHNFLADLKALNPLANAGNNARHFMANDTVMTYPRIHIAVIDMHICAANATKGNLHRYLAPGRLKGRPLFYGEGFVAAIKGSRNHLLVHTNRFLFLKDFLPLIFQIVRPDYASRCQKHTQNFAKDR
jgi:hypothetical protein